MRVSLRSKTVGFILGPLLFGITMLWSGSEDMSYEAKAVLAATLWVATWWVTEALPIPVTSILPVVLFPLTGALPLRVTTESYGHPLVFLYIGGFIIALAIERCGLHRRFALNILLRVGTDSRMIIMGFMIATAVLSMWISNTATTVMMLPIGMAIVKQFDNGGMRSEFGIALMLAIAYAASIGGLATLIGTPTNLIFAGMVDELYNVEISFAKWMAFGLPISIVLLIICWVYITRYAFHLKDRELAGGRQDIRRRIHLLGPMQYAEKVVSAVFAATALCWMLRSFILQKWLPGINDTAIALAGATALFLIPARNGKKDEKIIDWATAVQIPWGIILLFGGGLALAAGFQETGLAEWIGMQLLSLRGVKLMILVFVVIAAVNFLTEITSNLATASMILPILASLAVGIGVHPYSLMVAATVAASCAFMLPVATPPNAVVFGSGYLRIPDMVRTGIWMNIISIILLTFFVFYLLPLVWGIDLNTGTPG